MRISNFIVMLGALALSNFLNNAVGERTSQRKYRARRMRFASKCVGRRIYR